MALLDYPIPPALLPLRVTDARDNPLGGNYGQPHVMAHALIEFATDGDLLYDGQATPAWEPPNRNALRRHIHGGAAGHIHGPDFNGIIYINGEGSHWNKTAGRSDNCWKAVTTLAEVRRAAPLCVAWVEALREACPRALMAWYAKPTGMGFAENFELLQAMAPLQEPLLDVLDILSPNLYVWHDANPDGFDAALESFRGRLGWVRDRYPHKLLCPVVWEEFYYVGSWHNREEGQSCPALSGRRRRWATVATYNGKTGQPTCAQPSFTSDQWDAMLEMVFSIGCDGLFYWATANSWGKYFTDANEPGIRNLLRFAAQLHGAVPRGPHTATFLMDRGPFAAP
jgi:hypothetical protein